MNKIEYGITRTILCGCDEIIPIRLVGELNGPFGIVRVEEASTKETGPICPKCNEEILIL